VTVLCWILVDRTRRYVWRGPGFKAIGNELDLKRLPVWETKKEAAAVAKALRAAISVEAQPIAVSLL
jgi:hypothetical protein